MEFLDSLKPKDWVTLSGILLTFLIGIFNLFNGLKINKRTVFVNAITSERVKWMGELKQLLSEYLSLTSLYEDKPFYEGEERTKYFERLIFLKNKIKLQLNYIDHKDEEINTLIEQINDKIFGFYEARKLLDLPAQKRVEFISEEKMKTYFDRVIESSVDKEIAKKIIINGDKESLIQVLNLVSKEINDDFRKEYGYQGRDQLNSYIEELVEKSRIYLKVEWEKVKKEANKGKLKKTSWFDRFIQWLFRL